MKITNNLLSAIEKAEKDGIKGISVVCSSHFNTTYRHNISFDLIKSKKIGEEISYGRFNGETRSYTDYFYGYQYFMKKYSKPRRILCLN